MTVEPTRRQRRDLERENRMWPETLVLVPREQWPYDPLGAPPAEAWRSRQFLVLVYPEQGGVERLSVNRTSHNGTSWEANITWDELQRLKAECGRGDKMAVEIFPADVDVVHVANIRHLWVLPFPLPFAWRRQ